MKMPSVSLNIWDCIDRFKNPCWVVKRIPNTLCKCVDHTTKQASNSCELCLGLGAKIKIYKTSAVMREGKEQESVFSDTKLSATPKMIYFKFGEALIEKDDYVVDKEDIFIVFTKQYLKGEDGQAHTIKCLCPPLKMDSKIIHKNFKEILNKYGHKI